MIPKIIHYCWFGPAKYSEKVEYCINSWHKVLKDYKFILWNESNFDLDQCLFVRQAYDSGKYAFVSDYVRLWVLKEYGGIYLDTDIEVLRDFSSILNSTTVLGTDDTGKLTAFMATEADTPLFNQMVELYNNMNFILDNGKMNTVVNNEWIQKKLKEYGYRTENIPQTLAHDIKIYPCDYFHAKSLVSGKEYITENTFCIHHHTLLWVTKKTKILRFLRLNILVPLVGADRYRSLASLFKRK